MASGGTVTVNIVGDASKLRSALNDSESALGRFSGKMRDVGTSMMKVGAGITAGVTAPLVALGKVAFDSASDLNETISKSIAVFGDFSDGIFELGERSATSLGISKQAAMEAAATFGNLFTAMGMGKAPAARMSTDLVELAADLASFNNMDPTEVLEKLRSGLVGETEPLRSLGVAFLAADVERKAFELGLQSADGTLTESAKIQARYALIMEQTTTAQGDFGRTADGAANKQRILAARMKDAAATIGQQLMPIGQRLLDWASRLLSKFGELSPQTQKFVLIGAAIAAALGPAVTVIGALVTVLGVLLSPVGLIIIAVAALVAGVIYAYTHFERFREVVDGVIDDVRQNIDNFVTFAQTVWRNFGDEILMVAQGVWTTISGVVEGALKVIQGLIQTITALFRGDWSAAWDGMKRIVEGVWQAIVAVIEGFLMTVKGILSGAWTVISNAARSAWMAVSSAVAAGVNDAVEFASRLPGRILGAIGDLGRLLYNIGRDLIQGLIDGIGSMFGSVRNTLGNLTSSLTSWKGPPERDKRLLFGSGQAVIDGFRRGLEASYGGVQASLGGFTNSLSGGVNLTGTVSGVSAVGAPSGGRASGGQQVTEVIQLVLPSGQVLVEAIRSYERANGTGWRQ